MVKLEVTGACVDCPFMELEAQKVCLFEKPYWIIRCDHDDYCDREKLLQEVHNGNSKEF